ncbi:uncharacterized acetyltransferase At3g50280-like [Lotus japonicus]|uniref:uncharacterized acetyltransferase At3g50280-like n=1 Tax=Lotus japonicus TaxID=34305 RepID=UPI002584DD24|nr:uncharacterized acetyltransferase At3g50280-like [Lotus japonicus]
MSTPSVQLISECFIKPYSPIEDSNQICYLTPWDIALLSVHYIQKGLLFKKPESIDNQQDFMNNLLDNLKHSLSLALDHFYPLAGRLVTQKTQDPLSYAVFVDCINSPGAGFIHATLNMTISDILSPVDVPPVVHSFFDHHKAINHDGHTMPLLSIKVTELLDGVFIGCSMNHCIADGTSYWNFFNTWSELFQAKPQTPQVHVDAPIISHNPIHNRWFPQGCSDRLINLPFKHHDEFISRYESTKLRDRIFHFSAESITKLKAKANSESNSNKISSFQSLSAFVWKSMTRARNLQHDQKTSCKLTANNRSRMEPPLPEQYFGNSVHGLEAEATAGEVVENNLGWAAWKVHVAVANHGDAAVQKYVKEWLLSPMVYRIDMLVEANSVMMSSSPRFNVYGNEFGMGKAVAVRSGYANKSDGEVTAYPGREGGGSVDLEVCLLPETMAALESDEKFMSIASVCNNPMC